MFGATQDGTTRPGEEVSPKRPQHLQTGRTREVCQLQTCPNPRLTQVDGGIFR